MKRSPLFALLVECVGSITDCEDECILAKDLSGALDFSPLTFEYPDYFLEYYDSEDSWIYLAEGLSSWDDIVGIEDAFYFDEGNSDCEDCKYELFESEQLLAIYFCSDENCSTMNYKNEILAFKIEEYYPDYWVSMVIPNQDTPDPDMSYNICGYFIAEVSIYGVQSIFSDVFYIDTSVDGVTDYPALYLYPCCGVQADMSYTSSLTNFQYTQLGPGNAIFVVPVFATTDNAQCPYTIQETINRDDWQLFSGLSAPNNNQITPDNPDQHFKYEFRIRLRTDSVLVHTVGDLTLVVGCGFGNSDLIITEDTGNTQTPLQQQNGVLTAYTYYYPEIESPKGDACGDHNSIYESSVQVNGADTPSAVSLYSCGSLGCVFKITDLIYVNSEVTFRIQLAYTGGIFIHTSNLITLLAGGCGAVQADISYTSSLTIFQYTSLGPGNAIFVLPVFQTTDNAQCPYTIFETINRNDLQLFSGLSAPNNNQITPNNPDMHEKYEFRIRLTTNSGFIHIVDDLTLVVGCGFENSDLIITPDPSNLQTQQQVDGVQTQYAYTYPTIESPKGDFCSIGSVSLQSIQVDGVNTPDAIEFESCFGIGCTYQIIDLNYVYSEVTFNFQIVYVSAHVIHTSSQITLIPAICDIPSMILGLTSPPPDHIWQYEINNLQPFIEIEQFSGIPGCADIIEYRLYNEQIDVTETANLNIQYDSATNLMTISKLSDFNSETIFNFYIQVEDITSELVFYQTQLQWEIGCGESSTDYSDPQPGTTVKVAENDFEPLNPTELIFEEYINSYPQGDCIIEDYHISLDQNNYIEATELNRFEFTIFPVDLSVIKKYEFFMWAQVKGKTDWVPGSLKRLVVGCTTLSDIAIQEHLSNPEPIQMLMPGLGWSTDNVWTFPVPTSPLSFCEVINTEIIPSTANGQPSTAVYFQDNEACVQPCTSISVDPSNVQQDLIFSVASTFSHSNNLIHEYVPITFLKAQCPSDCLITPLNPNTGDPLQYFTLIEPADASANQIYQINTVNFLGTNQPLFIMDNFMNSWQNGCCEDQSDFILTIYSEMNTIHDELTAELDLINNQIIIKPIDPALYEIPAIYTFKLQVQLHNAYNWEVDYIADAPLYSLDVFFNCITDDVFEFIQGDPTLAETDAAETQGLGSYVMIDNIPVLVIEADINEIQESNQVIINVQERFQNDYRCPIVDYSIEKVIEGGTNQIIQESTYSSLFEINESGQFSILSSDIAIDHYQVYISEFNGEIWSETSDIYLIDITFVDPIPLILPNIAPIFIEDLVNQTIDLGSQNLTNLLTYEFPTVFDANNDAYSIEIQNLPHFVTFDSDENKLIYSIDNITSSDFSNYTIEITLKDNSANNIYQLQLEVMNSVPISDSEDEEDQVQTQETYLEMEISVSTSDDEDDLVGEYEIEILLEEQRKIEIELTDFSITGEIQLMFSEQLQAIDQYQLDIESLNQIKSEVFNLQYRCQVEEQEANGTVPELQEWKFLNFTPAEIKIKLNFTNPLYVSTFQEKDQLDIYFLYPNIFKAQSDLLSLEENYTILDYTVPPQAASEEDAELVETIGTISQTSTIISLAIPLGFMLLMRVGMNQTWSLYLMLQICSNFINIGLDENLYMPANSYAIFEIMKTVSFFKLLQSPVIKQWLKDNLFGHFEKALDFFINLGEVVISMIFFGLIIIITVILSKVIKDQTIINKIKKKIMWSSIFRSQIQMFMPTTILTLQLLSDLMNGNSDTTTQENNDETNNEDYRFLQEQATEEESTTTQPLGLQIFNIVTKIIMLLFVPVFAFLFLRKNHSQMSDSDFQDKYISLYTNLKPQNRFSYVFTLLFCLRRYILSVMTIFMNPFVALNIIFYMMLQLCQISMFLHFKPMITKLMNYVEIMNEVLIIFTAYFMMFFTNWIQDIELRYSLGFSLIHTIVGFVGLNFAIITVCLAIDVYWKYQKYKHDKSKVKHDNKKKQSKPLEEDVKQNKISIKKMKQRKPIEQLVKQNKISIKIEESKVSEVSEESNSNDEINQKKEEYKEEQKQQIVPMHPGIKEYLMKTKLESPSQMNEIQKLRSKRYIDFHNQKFIINYLQQNDFRSVDIYRDANCVARCIAAKVFNDESKWVRVKYGIYKQLKAEFTINAQKNKEFREWNNDELYQQQLDELKLILNQDFWFSQRELQAAAEYYNLHIIEFSYKNYPVKIEYKQQTNESKYQFKDNKLFLVVRKQSKQCSQELQLNTSDYYKNKSKQNQLYDFHKIILSPEQEDIYTSQNLEVRKIQLKTKKLRYIFINCGCTKKMSVCEHEPEIIIDDQTVTKKKKLFKKKKKQQQINSIDEAPERETEDYYITPRLGHEYEDEDEEQDLYELQHSIPIKNHIQLQKAQNQKFISFTDKEFQIYQ